MNYNPFLLNMPIVTIVKNVRIVDGVEVETEETDCVRQWGRIGIAYRGEETIDRFQPSKRLKNDEYGLGNLGQY